MANNNEETTKQETIEKQLWNAADKLRKKGVVSQAFVYFYLTNHKTLEWLQALAEGRSGTFPQITFDQLRDLVINIPSKQLLNTISVQCENWLKKIKTNHKKIRTLEKFRDTLLLKLLNVEVKVSS